MKEYLPLVAVAAALYYLKKRAQSQASGAVAAPTGGAVPTLPKNEGIAPGPKAGTVENVSAQQVAGTLDDLIYYAP